MVQHAAFAALLVLYACAPGGPVGAPGLTEVALTPGAGVESAPISTDALAPTEPAAGPLPDPWEARVTDLADPARPHASRWGSVRAFGRVEPDHPARADIAARLAALLPTEESRYYAVRALGFLGESSATDALVPLLGESSWAQRRYVALALEEIGAATPAVVSALEAALSDPLPAVRDQARRALGRLDPLAAGPVLESWYLDDRSTGLEIAVASPPDRCFEDGGSCRLEVTLTNRTDHRLELPPLSLSLERGLYLQDSSGRASWPWAGGEHRGEGAPLDPVVIEAGRSADVHLSVNLVPWTSGLPVDHSFRPAEPRWALQVGQITYLLHPANNPGGTLSVRVVLHPAYIVDLIRHLPRAAAFWTGKAVSDELHLSLPSLPGETQP